KKNPSSGFHLLVDLWEHKSGDKPSLLQSFDTLESRFEFEVERSARYILRLQPELLKSVEFNLSIHVGPSLTFPAATGRTQSFWGADRDGGNRSHEGIDIFAPRGTPALAAADGIVSRVDLNNLGGKVVFMRPSGKNLSFYYAHLDSQLVREGQRVKKGDTLGLIGNTGNARSTSPHLHFGIYALGGAIDPFPFVNPELRKAQPISQVLAIENALYRSTKEIKDLNIPKYQWLKSLSRSADHHLVELPNGNKLIVADNIMQKADNQLNNKSIKDTVALLDAPFANAPTKVLLMPGQQVNIIAYHESYSYVRSAKESGWLPSALLQ
ncbi:MAG TPA: M23 family metallopeptidase, partial [Chitinophagaceae bacterium]